MWVIFSGWLHEHSYAVHLLALAIMVIAAWLLYPAALAGTTWSIWVLLSLFVFANLLELSVR
jgi:hypothetical protein